MKVSKSVSQEHCKTSFLKKRKNYFATLGSAQGLFLALYTGITPSEDRSWVGGMQGMQFYPYTISLA